MEGGIVLAGIALLIGIAIKTDVHDKSNQVDAAVGIPKVSDATNVNDIATGIVVLCIIYCLCVTFLH